ncbi:MAG: hypothetical protein ER33_06010 [Cyanobium sp. CACIAM 14]|nr:MAG: hypothetical protein ER33_06010 [Cyanobium sp. CACIAM 14]
MKLLRTAQVPEADVREGRLTKGSALLRFSRGNAQETPPPRPVAGDVAARILGMLTADGQEAFEY